MEKAANGRDIFTDAIAGEIVAACGSGFTIEKAGALVGVNPSTVRTWCQRRPAFAREVETARKKHELSLLRDIQAAGDKSWQAKAWMAERIYNHAVPSARLQVTQEHTHGISGNLAQLLAGIAIRRKNTAAPKIEPLEIAGESDRKYIDIEPIRQTRESEIMGHKSNNKYCINYDKNIDSQQLAEVKLPKLKHKRMRLRKPRSRPAMAAPTTTPLPGPPAPVYHA